MLLLPSPLVSNLHSQLAQPLKYPHQYLPKTIAGVNGLTLYNFRRVLYGYCVCVCSKIFCGHAASSNLSCILILASTVAMYGIYQHVQACIANTLQLTVEWCYKCSSLVRTPMEGTKEAQSWLVQSTRSDASVPLNDDLFLMECAPLSAKHTASRYEVRNHTLLLN